MAQRSKKGSLLASLSSLPIDNASAEAAWRQALLLREFSRDEREPLESAAQKQKLRRNTPRTKQLLQPNRCAPSYRLRHA